MSRFSEFGNEEAQPKPEMPPKQKIWIRLELIACRRANGGSFYNVWNEEALTWDLSKAALD